jgi:hypothetical protein
MCLRQAQAPCNKRIGGWACRSHCGWNFCVCFYITKSTEILLNDGVFEFSKEHRRCSRKYTDFNTIEIMCLRQAQAPCNKRIGGCACRSHCVWNFCICFNNTKFTEILWNDCVIELPKKHQRCSIERTDFNTIEIMCLRQAQAPCNEIIGGWACRSHYVWNICVCFNITKFTEILGNDGVFEFSKEHRRCSRKHTDFNAIEIMCLRLRSGTV